jgi:hypothetical protein
VFWLLATVEYVPHEDLNCVLPSTNLYNVQIGKTVLSHLVCKGEVLPNSSYTIGCSTEVKVPPF